MRIMNLLLIALALAAGASWLGCNTKIDEEPIPMADVRGGQDATVTVNNGFSPSTISVKAGEPVRLTFDTIEAGCATEVIFEKPKIRKALTNGQKTVVTFTPDEAGTYAFACPMGMYKGSVVAK
ncbi:MAG: cupredoxin domain-containing protein [Armatimonadetes bacterium]|nr:cupredoxin domain-containing protein [Armatimonadota bacterium]